MGYYFTDELGRPLHEAEWNEMLRTVRDAIAAVNAAIPPARGIASIQVVGAQMTVTLQDGSTQGPFTLPLSILRPRGNWAPEIIYSRADLVYQPNQGIYLVELSHTSPATFDPNFQIETDPGPPPVLENVYRLIFPVPPGPLYAPVEAITSLPYTLVLNDGSKWKRYSGTLIGNILIPDSSTFPINWETTIRQASTGQITFVPQGSVVLNYPTGYNPKTAVQGATVLLKKVEAAVWDLTGLLEEQP